MYIHTQTPTYIYSVKYIVLPEGMTTSSGCRFVKLFIKSIYIMKKAAHNNWANLTKNFIRSYDKRRSCRLFL